ncbi:hypothetical protein SBA2_710014 [Acidobacteriia bacterium SbA2]|nr:hypothetical protein SBA2_710014 [Acidobacteriia bacterium SbA2]
MRIFPSSVNVYGSDGLNSFPQATWTALQEHGPERWANLPLLSVTLRRRWALRSARCIARCMTTRV